jgi:hypothetical protein
MREAQLSGVSKWIGNAVILLAGAFLVLGAAIAFAIIFAYAFAVVIFRRLRGTMPRRPALTAGA